MKKVHFQLARINWGLIVLLSIFVASLVLAGTGVVQLSDDAGPQSAAAAIYKDFNLAMNRSAGTSD
jgi:hypothetical protein